jgi:hypothetical protein
MSEATKDIIKALPKWVFTVAFCVFVAFMVVSLFLGTFKIGGFEFGFSPKSKDSVDKDSVDKDSVYTVIGTVETSDKKPPYEITISPRFPPLFPSAEGTIVGLDVWKGPDGKFPILYFSHQSYAPVAIDLNDTDKVSIVKDGKDLKIQIKKTIIMLRYSSTQ